MEVAAVRARALGTVVACAALLASACERGEPADGIGAGHTSVLWLTLCTLRADHLGAYGYGPDVSPRIDGLASNGVVFDNAWAASPWTRPSMAAAVTGIYPRSLNIDEPAPGLNDRRLHESFITLAEDMQAAGYVTVGVTANPNTNAVFGFDQGFDSYVDTGRLWREGYARSKLTADDVGARFLAELRRAGIGKPFFGQLTYVDVHDPLLIDEVAHRYPELEDELKGRGTASYDVMIRNLDDSIGRLLDELEALGYGNLLVIVTSDHGEGFGAIHDDDRGHGRALYNSTIRVPWILRHPSLTPGRVAGRVGLVSLRPTVLDLLGIAFEIPQGEGISLVRWLRGEADVSVSPVSVVETAYEDAMASAILDDRWKLIVDYSAAAGAEPTLRLYALDDVGEQVDRSRERADVASRLLGRLADWQRAHPPRIDASRLDTRVDRETRERLRSLGYVE
jgi:arylsulfatase A-like enzyme